VQHGGGAARNGCSQSKGDQDNKIIIQPQEDSGQAGDNQQYHLRPVPCVSAASMCRNAGQLSLIQRVLTKSYSSGWLAGPNMLPEAFCWPGLREPIEAVVLMPAAEKKSNAGRKPIDAT
jgi:hypothetical protein